MTPSRNTKAAAFGNHLNTAVVVGLLAALLYFGGEVLLAHRGKYLSLGQPLLRILAIYLAAIAGGMAVFGVVSGLFGAFTGRLSRHSARWGLHVGAAGFALALLWTSRWNSVAGFKRILVTAEAWKVLGMLAVAVALGLLVRRLAKRLDSRAGSRRGALIVPIAAAAIVVLFVTSRESRSIAPKANAPSDGPNVVMIVLDALRADHLSTYGYSRETSPRLDQLADEGVTFLNARSHGNRTILAMPALFTSLYPSFNGAISVGSLMRPLGEDKTTIAEMLRDRGYSTAALMTNIHLKSVFGMTQGFDHVEEFNGGCYSLSVYRALRVFGLVDRPDYAVRGRPRATGITDDALAWLDQLDRAEPFFLYVHYMDTHHPYQPPPEFADIFGGIETDPTKLFMESKKKLMRDPTAKFGDEELELLRRYYDACIRYNDHELGRILDRVREISKNRETVVVVTADHGDEFLEHGTLYHNNVLIEELTRVPLIIWDPSRFDGRQRVESMVRHIDLMPTLAELTGASLPTEAMGQSLVPLMTGKATDLDVTAFAEGDYCTSYIDGDWKVTYVDSTNESRLYNLREDPKERNDLAGVERERLDAMMTELYDYRERAAAVRSQMEATSDEETIRQLRALGYIN